MKQWRWNWITENHLSIEACGTTVSAWKAVYLKLDMADYEVSVQQLNDLLTDENGDFCMPSKHFNEVYPGILLGNE